jgi:glycosyltransferase involved in cell wall biosynthesis
MKALVIAPQPFFSPRGTPLSVYYRTLVATELGVKIDLLTYGEGQDVEIPGMRIIRIPRFSFLGSVRIGPSYLKLFLDIFLLIWTVRLLLKNRYRFVHAHEEAVFFCRLLKPIFRFKLIYDMHSSLPQQLANFQFTRSKVLIKLFKHIENSSLHSADAIITICPYLSSYVEGVIKDEKKHFLIENSIFEPVKLLSGTFADKYTHSVTALSEEHLDLPAHKRFVVYAGTLEPYQGIDFLLEAFQKIAADAPDVSLLIVGGDQNQVAHYKTLAHKNGLKDKIIFTGSVPQSLAKQYSKRASVLVSPRLKGTNTPLKMYEQLASGIPVVATDIHSHTQVLSNEVAFLVNPTPEDMAQGILEALNSSAYTLLRVEKAKRLYEKKYSRPVYEAKMREVLKYLSG